MQPPPPRKPVPTPSLGQESQQRSSPTRHPQSPPDLSFAQDEGATPHLLGTRDPALIRAWADHHGAEPGTGEASASGPATVNVNDQGTGIRFNFPGASRFRPIEWDEWLAHFDRESLVFVFEVESSDPASAPSRFGGAFFRLVSAQEWAGHPLAALDT